VIIRLYCDVPPVSWEGMMIYANSSPPSGAATPGYKRVAIDVDLPIKDHKAVDLVAPGTASAVPDA